MNSTIIKYFEDIVSKENIFVDEPMSRHTTFRCGGPASLFIRVTDPESLKKVVTLCTKLTINYYIVGNGSNLLVADEGFDGVIISMVGGMDEITVTDDRIHVQAGALNSKIAMTALEHSLTGFEFAHGIPGSIGGGLIMNAGAYGSEMKQVISRVELYDPEGETLYVDNEGMRFGYRSSAVKGSRFIIMSADIQLAKGDKEQIDSLMKDLIQRRRDKQPLDKPSAGSTFKRPEGHFAGKLIEDAGLRGFRVGGAMVSDKHCGFVVNDGGATAADVRELIRQVQDKVYENSGVRLEPEVIMLG